MPLRSAILAGNARLEQAASGGAPIKAAPPQDDLGAVRRIQKAMVALLNISMPRSFPNGPKQEPDGVFGNETVQAVIRFQQRVFPSDSRQWDGRVGKLTLGEMDKRLPAGGAVTPPPASANPVMDIILAGTAPHNLGKSDLESTLNVGALTLRQKAAVFALLPLHPLAGGLPLGMLPVPLIKHSTRSLELYFTQEALAASLASAGGQKLISDFFGNAVAKKEILYPEGSEVSILVRDNPSFATSANAFEGDFTRRMRLVRTASGGAVNPGTLRSDLEKHGGSMTPPALPFFGIGSKLGILGSFQESRVRLTRLETPAPRSFRATLRYEVFDHFGCDDKDLEGLPTHGTPGQIAMWLLARDPKHSPGHKPFVVRIHVTRIVSDTQT